MAMKKIKFYYYKLDVNYKGNLSDEESLDRNEQIRRALMPSGFTNSFQNQAVIQTEYLVKLIPTTVYTNEHPFVYGAFSLLQVEDIPPKAQKDELEPHQLDLSEDEGLLYVTPFLFNREHLIFMFPSGRPGVSLSSAEKYFKNNFDIPDFKFVKITNPDEWIKLQEQEIITRLAISMHLPLSDSHLKDALKKSESSLEKLVSEMGGQKVRFTISSPKKSGGLKSNFIIRWVKKYLNTEEKPDMLKITAYDEDGGKQILDLITKPLIDTIEIE